MNATERKYKQAEDEYVKALDNLIDYYGDVTSIPPEKHRYISEILRAKYILARFPEEEPAKLLGKYLVVPTIATEILGMQPTTELLSKTLKRKDKYQTIVNWCKENVGSETTVFAVAEIGNVSYPTANNFIKNRTDLFAKIKKGSYIVRDPETERALEKQ